MGSIPGKGEVRGLVPRKPTRILFLWDIHIYFPTLVSNVSKRTDTLVPPSGIICKRRLIISALESEREAGSANAHTPRALRLSPHKCPSGKTRLVRLPGNARSTCQSKTALWHGLHLKPKRFPPTGSLNKKRHSLYCTAYPLYIICLLYTSPSPRD